MHSQGGIPRPAEVIRFDLDCNAGSLAVTMNGKPRVTIFRDLSPGATYFPCVASRNSQALVELVSVKSYAGAEAGRLFSPCLCSDRDDEDQQTQAQRRHS